MCALRIAAQGDAGHTWGSKPMELPHSFQDMFILLDGMDEDMSSRFFAQS